MRKYILGLSLANSAGTIVATLKSILTYKDCFVGYRILSYFPEDMDVLPMVRMNLANFGIPETDPGKESETPVLQILGNERFESWDGESSVFVVQSEWIERIEDRVRGEPTKDPGENIIVQMPLSKTALLKNAFEYIRRDFDQTEKHLWEIASSLEAAGEKKRALEYYKQMCESKDTRSKYLGGIRSLELLPCPSLEYIECLSHFAEDFKDLPETTAYLMLYMESYPALPSVRVQSGIDKDTCIRFNRFGIRNRELLRFLKHFEESKRTNDLIEEIHVLSTIEEPLRQIDNLTILAASTFPSLSGFKEISPTYPITLSINIEHMADRPIFEPFFDVLFGSDIPKDEACIKANEADGIRVPYSTLFELASDPERRPLFQHYIDNISRIDRILDPTGRTLLWIDIEPSETSVRRFLEHQDTNAIYIGVAAANIGSSEYLDRELKGSRFMLVGGANAKIQRNIAGLLPQLGVSDPSGVVVWKQVRDSSLVETNEHFVNFVHPPEISSLTKNSAYVINLRERTDRWQQVQKDMGDCLDLERFEAVRRSPGWIGCFLSHQAIIREAKQRGDQTVLIVEDDCYLDDPTTFPNEWAHIKHWLDTNLDKWDIFLGGCGCVREEDVQHVFSDNVSGVKFVQLSRSTSTHFIYWNRSLFDRILAYTPTAENYMPIDVYSWHALGARILTIVPFLAKQRESYSDIEDRVVEYEGIYNASTLSIQKSMSVVAQTPIFFWTALEQRGEIK